MASPQGRTPTPAEAAVLRVYLEAERALVRTVAAEARRVVDAPDDGTDAARLAGAERVARAAEGAFRGLERGKRGLVDGALDAARNQGVAAAAAQLSRITGRGATQYADTVNRGALDRLAASVLDRLSESHQSILRTTVDAFRDVVSQVLPASLVGAETRRETTQRAVWALSDQGIKTFVDRAGRRWSLAAYAEMAVRSASARAMVDGQTDRLAAAGRDLVIVGGSGDRCPECRPWSGAVLSISGNNIGAIEVEHGTRDGVMVTVQVAGSVAEARSAGLLHPNCRCSLSAYLPGVTQDEPAPPDNGQYAARQQQRAIERAIRASKAREATALDQPARRRAAANTRGQQARMRAHLAANPDLLRRSYREQIGGGNTPTRGVRERLPDGPTPTVVPSAARAPRDMSDAELDNEMQDALARDDLDGFERFAAETDRRDTRRARNRERRTQARERRDEEQANHMERLLAAGVNEEEAVADVYGITVERQRRDAARARLVGNGYSGTFEQMSRSAFRDEVRQEWIRAEDATRGSMTRRGTPARVTAASLWTRNEAFARRWASEELLLWWDQNGRLTYDQYVDGLLNGGARGTTSGGDFLR